MPVRAGGNPITRRLVNDLELHFSTCGFARAHPTTARSWATVSTVRLTTPLYLGAQRSSYCQRLTHSTKIT